MKISVRHQLRFDLGQGTQRAVAQILLHPQNGPTQTVHDWTLDLDGIDTAQTFYDAYANRTLLLSQAKPEGEKILTVTGTVETHDRHGVLGRIPGEPVVALFRRVTDLTRPDEKLVEHFRDHDPAQRITFFHALMTQLSERFDFASDEPEGEAELVQDQDQAGQSQSQRQTQSGTTEDATPEGKPPASAAGFAHAFISTCRALDIPARFVTGYLAESEDGPAAFHAWAEAFDDGLGWIGFDAALGICPTDRHIRVAAGLDALTTTPLRVVPALGAPAVVTVTAVEQ